MKTAKSVCGESIAEMKAALKFSKKIGNREAVKIYEKEIQRLKAMGIKA